MSTVAGSGAWPIMVAVTAVLGASSLAGCGIDLPSGKLRCALTAPRCPAGYDCSFDDRCWKTGTAPPMNAPTGSSCEFGPSCSSTFCSDGVCCESDCAKTPCSTCAAAGSQGTCVPVADATLASSDHPACAADEICIVGQCGSQLANGKPCTAAGQCSSGQCVDGVCCETDCTCGTCNLSGNEGHCTLAGAGSDPRGRCAAMTVDARCPLSCDAQGSCGPPIGDCGTDCTEDASMNTPVFQPTNSNQHSLQCNPATRRCETIHTTTSCNAASCQGNICATTCVSDFSCDKGFYCSGASVCAPAGNTTCTRPAQCTSGFCDPGTSHCMECVANTDCPADMYCSAGACVTTASCAILACAARGNGSSCTATGSTAVAHCIASAASDCTNPRAPHYVGGICQCDNNVVCAFGEVCSAKMPPARCVGLAGRPCFEDAVCASGVCSPMTHICDTGAANTPCVSDTDCKSSTCVSGMCTI